MSSFAEPPCQLQGAQTQSRRDVPMARLQVRPAEPQEPHRVVADPLHGLGALDSLLQEAETFLVPTGERVGPAEGCGD